MLPYKKSEHIHTYRNFVMKWFGSWVQVHNMHISTTGLAMPLDEMTECRLKYKLQNPDHLNSKALLHSENDKTMFTLPLPAGPITNWACFLKQIKERLSSVRSQCPHGHDIYFLPHWFMTAKQIPKEQHTHTHIHRYKSSLLKSTRIEKWLCGLVK